jgi:serine/threonine protein kinase
MTLAPGSRVGPYQIEAAIGAGGMGEVYRARDTRLDRVVAVKTLPVEFSGDAQRRARFRREAKAIARLTHPHICALHDVGEHEGTDYLVMELLEGETLAQRLSRGALPIPRLLPMQLRWRMRWPRLTARARCIAT